MAQGPTGVIAIDIEAMQDWQKQHREAAQRLQRAQHKYAGQVSRLLAPASRADFEARVRRLSYPRVLAPSAVDRQWEAIVGLADLDEEQRASLAAMRAEYDRARARLDEAWMRAIDAELAAKDGGPQAPSMIGNVQVFVGGEASESGAAEARASRGALDEQWVQKLRGVLRPEQEALVPAPAPERRMIIRTIGGGDPDADGGGGGVVLELAPPG